MCLPDCYSMRITTFLNYYWIDWWCNVDFRLIACWFEFRFHYSYFTWKTSGLELASTIILVLQASYVSLGKYSFSKQFLKRIDSSFEIEDACIFIMQKDILCYPVALLGSNDLATFTKLSEQISKVDNLSSI